MLPAMEIVPWLGPVRIAKVELAPVIDELKSNDVGVLNGTEILRAPTPGGAMTAMVIVAGAEVPPMPVAVYVKLSAPV